MEDRRGEQTYEETVEYAVPRQSEEDHEQREFEEAEQPPGGEGGEEDR